MSVAGSGGFYRPFGWDGFYEVTGNRIESNIGKETEKMSVNSMLARSRFMRIPCLSIGLSSRVIC